MSNGKQRTSRRREVRRAVPRPGPRWMRPLQRGHVLWVAAYVLLFAMLAWLIALPDAPRFRHEVGDLVTDPVIARVDFQTVNREQTRELRTEARNNVPRVHLPHEELLEDLRDALEELLTQARYETLEEVDSETVEQLGLTEAAFAELRNFVDEEGEPTDAWQQVRDRLLQRLFEVPLLEPEQYQDQQQTTQAAGRIEAWHPMLAEEQRAQEFRRDQLIDAGDEEAIRDLVRPRVDDFPDDLRLVVARLVEREMAHTYRFDGEAQQLTEQRMDEAAEAIDPVHDEHHQNEVLIDAGHELTSDDLELLEDEWQAFSASRSTFQRWVQHGALFGMMLALGVGVWSYVLQNSRRIIENPFRAFALGGLLIGCQALAVVAMQIPPSIVYIAAVLPSLFAAVVITIAYNQRLALGLGALHALLVVVTLDLSIPFAIVLLTGIAVSVALLRDVRGRSTVVGVGLASGIAMAVLVILVGIVDRPLHLGEPLRRIGIDALYALTTGIFTGLLVQGLLPGIEKAFKVTTAMTLRELNDVSHPLLSRLAQEAPGTFQHSQRIADMAEAAAESIGADGLLCRVGAMYHDIGKINKPQYFIENQSGGPNWHKKLSPAMSLLIIVGHVKDGIEMAREYRLPAPIRHFIESHHGTTLVEYFYHAARKQKEEEEAPGPSEFEFRYPGPKPQTREAAIMLLCDSVEAAARSLPEPTPVRLEQIVHRMATKRLMDGQFDECNLTLQQLRRIEDAITKMLTAIYHGRVKYPSATSSAEPSAAESSRPPRAQAAS